jgi:hypothetical protein
VIRSLGEVIRVVASLVVGMAGLLVCAYGVGVLVGVFWLGICLPVGC